jgi:prepilin-type N-terminal cleavage/methylation domain-containing protein
MPTLATCRNSSNNSHRSRRSKPRANAGFTLLEMMVVLAIVALVVGVAAVNAFALMHSWRARTQLDAIGEQFAHLPMLARQRGRAIVLPPKADPDPENAKLPPAITLPANWLIRFDHPLKVQATGLCEGATITLEHYDRTYQRRILPPFCQWQAIDEAQ